MAGLIGRITEALRRADAGKQGVPDYPELARVVLEAIRVPTDHMICAALDDWDKRGGKQTYGAAWGAMIDAALSEETE